MGKVDFSLYKPQNEIELYNYIKLFTGLAIPSVSIMPGSTPPFEFLSNAFFDRVKDALLIAGRGSGKTENFALIAWLLAKFNKDIEVDLVGAIQQQSMKGYSYVKDFATKYSDCKSTLMHETAFTNGSSISVLSGSISSLNSPHPQVAIYDEVELSELAKIQEFENMPASKSNFEASEFLGSSLKYANGVLMYLLDTAGYELNSTGISKLPTSSPRKVYLWTSLDVAQKCTLPSCEKCKHIIRKEDGMSFYDVCQGRLKNADGFLPVKDIMNKFLRLDKATFDSQILSKRPQPKNLLYPWAASSIEDFSIVPETHQIFGGLDFGGYPDPNVLILAYLKGTHLFLFKEIYTRKMSPSQFMQEVKKTIKPLGKVILFGDPSGKSFFREAQVNGLRLYNPITRNIDEGINYVNSIGLQGQIHIHKDMYYTIKELTTMYRTDRGIIRAPNGDHASDASRYMITSAYSLYGKKGHVLGA